TPNRADEKASSVMHPASAARWPEAMRLAAQNACRKTTVRIDRRAFPKQQTFDRQLREPRVAVRTGRVRALIPGGVERLDDRSRELTAGIGKVRDRLAEVPLEL